MPGTWTARILALLAVEKVIQHVVVTYAFATDAFDMRDSVAVDYRVLLWTGASIAVLYGVALAGLLRRARWSLGLLASLAVVDIVGEFIGQGEVWITLNVSFIAAVAILVLVARQWRSWEAVR